MSTCLLVFLIEVGKIMILTKKMTISSTNSSYARRSSAATDETNRLFLTSKILHPPLKKLLV